MKSYDIHISALFLLFIACSAQGIGSPCSFNSLCDSACCADRKCSHESFCYAAKDEDDYCDFNGECESLRCYNNKCESESCSYGGQCHSQCCSLNTCVDPQICIQGLKMDRDRCSYHHECTFGCCEYGVCRADQCEPVLQDWGIVLIVNMGLILLGIGSFVAFRACLRRKERLEDAALRN